MYEFSFSVASKINVKILGGFKKKSAEFISAIFADFDGPLDKPNFTINIKLTDNIPKLKEKVSLGKDGVYGENFLVLKTGHYFVRFEKSIEIGVPTKVKRGRVPFKRSTPGRHITDEVLEPILANILLENGCTFLHAATYIESNKAQVLMGWRGTGKTKSILQEFEKKRIWADDLSILDEAGFVYPYNRPIRIYSYNIPSLSDEYVKNNFLNIKRFFTPPWRPVHYLPINNIDKNSKVKLGNLTFLNDIHINNLEEISDQIMAFEHVFFEEIKIMLQVAKIFDNQTTTKKIVAKALKN
jgi:hypothetical protein